MKVLATALGLAVLLSAAAGYLRRDDAPVLRDIHYSKDIDYSVSAVKRSPHTLEPFTKPADRP
ncbi:MAG: hypothetical protein AB1490_04125 [Pseudomonadota bacterium]